MQLIVGRVVKPHGIRGEVIVEVRTDEPEARFVAGSVFTTEAPKGRGRTGPGAGPSANGARGSAATGPPSDASGGSGTARPAGDSSGDAAAAVPGKSVSVPPELTLEAYRWHQGRLIAEFAGFADRDVAEVLRGVLLCVDSADIEPPSDPDEFHDHQLVGLTVVSVDGEPLGEVAHIDHAPASDLIVLRRPAGGTALIPFVREMVPDVDLVAGRVIVDLPDGLLDL
jgi:16S rRNA processing protein RimM